MLAGPRHLLLTALLGAGCYGQRNGGAPLPPSREARSALEVDATEAGSTVTSNGAELTSASATRKHENPALAVFEHHLLRAMESEGYDFATMALNWRRATSGTMDNRTLSENVRYASIIETLGRDVEAARRRDAAAGVGMRFSHRLFDRRWLTHPQFRFELVAVVNRMDRRPFFAGSCGELRLVYRLAYSTDHGGRAVSSRLPMTVNVVYALEGPNCGRWLHQPTGEAFTRAAVSRPSEADRRQLQPMLNAALAGEIRLRSVEVNLQLVRWPSTVRPSLGGHAEYLLRVFRPDDGGKLLVAAPMENTPDVARLSRDAALLEELSSWLKEPEQAAAVAEGTVKVPDRFLTTSVVSVAPHGLARRSNRPFTALLEPHWRDLPGADETLRRLDGLSCPGCHQSRSVAGFHVLGQDAPEMRADRLMVSHSPHFSEDAERRRRYVAALLGGEVPDEYRPPAEHPSHMGSWGSRCALDRALGETFAAWTCAPGFTCRAVDDALVGECVSMSAEVGDACEPGETSWGPPNSDHARLLDVRDCGVAGVCEKNAVGFPGGMCSGACDQRAPKGAVCGDIAVLDAFNACVARGELFTRCVETASRPGLLRSCSSETPCRDDYVCAVTSRGEGGCIPPYFLFQLRVDGHPL